MAKTIPTITLSRLYTHSLGGFNKRLKLLSNPLYPTWIHATWEVVPNFGRKMSQCKSLNYETT